MRWHLLHLGSRCPGPGVELVDEETGEPVQLHQVYRLQEVFLRLTWEPTDYICGDGDAWDPKKEKESKTSMLLFIF